MVSWTCLGLPLLLGLIHPGWSGYDEIMGLEPLPFQATLEVFGFSGLFAGAWLLFAAQQQDRRWSRRSVIHACTNHSAGPIRQRIRHPRSLAFFIMLLSGGLIAGSSSILHGGLLLIVPVHVFNLIYVVECAHERLYGNSYASYRRNVPIFVPSKQHPENEPASVD